MEEIYCFAGNPLDRVSQRRQDAGWVASLLEDPATRVLPLHGLANLTTRRPVRPGRYVISLTWSCCAPAAGRYGPAGCFSAGTPHTVLRQPFGLGRPNPGGDRLHGVRPSVLFAAAVERAHRRQIIHDCAQLGVGFRLQAAMPGHGNKVIHLVVANGAQSPHEGFRLV